MMKRLLLCFFYLSAPLWGTAQVFQEVCENVPGNGTLVSFERYQDTLYATGFFTNLCGASADYVAHWEDGQWVPAHFTLTDPGHALRKIGEKLYIAKYEQSVDSNWVWVYDGQELKKMGQGVYLTNASGGSNLPNIYDLIEYQGEIIACGEFDRAGNQPISGIARWDGSQWDSLTSGLSDHIINTPPVLFPHQMMVHDSSLYVVGNFRYAGGVEVNGVARWDGTTWHPLGAGFNGTVYSITTFEGEIYAGGSFTVSGGEEVLGIARWEGSQWVSPGWGFTASSPNDFIFLHTLKVLKEQLYMAGGLKQITYDNGDKVACGGVVAYSGESLNTFGGGVSGNDIEAIPLTSDDRLLIGGGVFGSSYTGISDVLSSTSGPSPITQARVFPNPFDQGLHIHSEIPYHSYLLTDLSGQVLSKGDFRPDLPLQLPSGLYVLQLINDHSREVIKVIKK